MVPLLELPLDRLLLSVVLHLTTLSHLAKLLGGFGSCRWSLLRTVEPLYRSCHVRLEVKDSVKAAQLEGLTDWGLQGRQGNISAVASGKLVVVDQRRQSGAVHRSQLGAVPRIHLSRDHYYCNPVVVMNTQFHLSSSRFQQPKNLEHILPFTIIQRGSQWAYFGPGRKADF
jgi:hypothetical protein